MMREVGPARVIVEHVLGLQVEGLKRLPYVDFSTSLVAQTGEEGAYCVKNCMYYLA